MLAWRCLVLSVNRHCTGVQWYRYGVELAQLARLEGFQPPAQRPLCIPGVHVRASWRRNELLQGCKRLTGNK
jgi:hypothetical protein